MQNIFSKPLENQSNQEVTKLLTLQQQSQNKKASQDWISWVYETIFGIATLTNEEFHQELKSGRKDFRKTRITNADLVDTNLDGVNLSGVNLRNVNMSRSSLQNAQLHKTKLVGANLDSANLKGASLSRANLKDAQASWADLRNTNLSNTRLQYANLTGADLDKSQSLLQAKNWFTKLEHARLPDGVFLEKKLIHILICWL